MFNIRGSGSCGITLYEVGQEFAGNRGDLIRPQQFIESLLHPEFQICQRLEIVRHQNLTRYNTSS